MNKLLPLGLLCILTVILSGCGKRETITYRAEWNDPERAEILVDSIERVLIRRFAALEIEDPSVTVVPENQTSAVVTVEISDPEDHDAVIHVFDDMFTFDLRVEAGTIPVADLSTIEWQPTGVDGSMVDWVQAVGDRQTSIVRLEIDFTDEGQTILEELARTKQGKRLGIFVRDLLVSTLIIQTGSFGETVMIEGIPSAVVAEIFADDVNVGLHVTYSPL